MDIIDLLFPVTGERAPLDHGYALYGALSRVVPDLHAPDRNVGVFGFRGTPADDGVLLLAQRAVLRLRMPTTAIPTALNLAGKPLDLDGHRVRLGVPRVQSLIPAAALHSPLVALKLNGPKGQPRPRVTPDRFLEVARRKLTAPPDDNPHRGGLALSEKIELSIPPQAGDPQCPARRVIRVKGSTDVGYALLVRGLSAEDSLTLQAAGLGGRRAMGCGLFLSARARREV